MTEPIGALRRSLNAGGVYDLALGVFILLAGPRVMEALGHPLVDARFHFLLASLPLLLLPALYFAAARAADPGPFRAPVLWARAGGGMLILALTVWLSPPVAWIYLALGLGDWGWALIHAVLWRR